NLSYDIGSNSSVRLNALYAQDDDPTEVTRVTTNLRVSPNTVQKQWEDIPGEDRSWEVGGDYEYNFNNGHRFKILFIANQEDETSKRTRYDILDDGSRDKNLYLYDTSVSEERIVRSSYTMRVVQQQDIEFGVERAQTTLDSHLRLGLKSA